jgi:hypothetical protein
VLDVKKHLPESRESFDEFLGRLIELIELARVVGDVLTLKMLNMALLNEVREAKRDEAAATLPRGRRRAPAKTRRTRRV